MLKNTDAENIVVNPVADGQSILVSVIVPVYNVEPYLQQCLDSVVNQTYENLEILIIDDGSTDGSGVICDEYERLDSRIKVIHTVNRGLSAARNRGLDEAKGEYISFIDSDDWFELDAIEIVMREAYSSNADIVCFRYVQEYKNVSFIPRCESNQRRELIAGDIIEEFCNGSGIETAAWNKFYKKGIFSDIVYPEGRYYEDIAIICQLLKKAGKVVCIPSILVHYRSRSNSITNCLDLKIISDYWWARYNCYVELNSISKEYGYSQLKYCVGAIYQIWRLYFGFTTEDKKNAVFLHDSMRRFVTIHLFEVLKNPNISWFNKTICVFENIGNPIVMRMLCFSERVIKCLRIQDKKQERKIPF